MQETRMENKIDPSVKSFFAVKLTNNCKYLYPCHNSADKNTIATVVVQSTS